MFIRDFVAQIKAAGPDDGLKEGQFLAIVSAFGNVDSYGERVVKGAFADDVIRWKDGEPLPIVWSHKWDDPFSHIGAHDDVEETDRGLQVLASVDQDNPTAVQVHRLMKGRRIRQFSFAYDVLESTPVEETVATEKGEDITRTVLELRKLRTYEVGPCLVGVNQETELIAAKAAGLQEAVRRGRQLDTAGMAQLAAAADSLREVVTLYASSAPKAYPDPQQKPSQPVTPPADDEPQAKSDKAASTVPLGVAAIQLMFP